MLNKIGQNLKNLKNKVFNKQDKQQGGNKGGDIHQNEQNGLPQERNQNQQQNSDPQNINGENDNEEVKVNVNQEEGQNNMKQDDRANKKNTSFSNKLRQKSQALKDAVKKAAGQVNDIKQDISNEFNKFDQRYKETMSQQKDKFNVWVRLKVEEAILRILQKQLPKVKRMLTDPYMFRFIKQLIHDMIDNAWPDIEEYIKEALRPNGYQRVPVNIKERKPDVSCFVWPWYQLTRWYRYTTQPYNKSFWHKIRRISWWFILLISLFPLYGVQSYLHALYFLMIDKSDEWQLLLYIVSFKRMQYFSIGVAGSLIGYGLFFACSTINDYQTENDYYRCKDEGPGSKINIVSDIIGFLLQIVLCWLGFLLLPFSKKKGSIIYESVNKNKPEIKEQQKKDENKIQEPQNVNIYDINNNDAQQMSNQDQGFDLCCFKVSGEKIYCDKFFNFKIRGGRLKCFMVYDIVVFLICLAIMLISIFVNKDTQQDWQKYQLIYLMKTIYGILNFPWLIFLFPPMMNILTKANETGYDRYGCIQLQYVNQDEIKKSKAEQKKSMKEKEKELNGQQKVNQDASLPNLNQKINPNDLESVGLLNQELDVEELIQKPNV